MRDTRVFLDGLPFWNRYTIGEEKIKFAIAIEFNFCYLLVSIFSVLKKLVYSSIIRIKYDFGAEVCATAI